MILKKIGFGTLVCFLCLSIACSSEDLINQPDEPLAGVIGGESWTYAAANAYGTDGEYELLFLSSAESGVDANECGITSPAEDHLSVLLPLETNYYTLPLVDNNETVRFHTSLSSSAIALSGYIHITSITGGFVFGYMDATLDDENTVEGSFQAAICN